MDDATKQKLKAMLTEYKVLKAEIQNRSFNQNVVLQLHGAALVVIFGFVASANLLPWIFFLIPVESSIFGLYYFDNLVTINNIGAYIQRRIEREVNRLVLNHPGDNIPALDWETSSGDSTDTRSSDEKALIQRHSERFRTMLRSTYIAPSVLALVISLALIVLSVPGVHTVSLPVVGSLSKTPDLYPGFLFLVAVLAFLVDIFFTYIIIRSIHNAFKLGDLRQKIQSSPDKGATQSTTEDPTK